METHKEYTHHTKHCTCTCPPCKQVGCRNEHCDTEFTIRFDGLEESLTYQIYGLLGNEVIIELDNGNKIQGTLNFVGFSFVEILIGEPSKDRAHEKGQSLIVSVSDLVGIELVC